jgi:hypothetical protein
MHESPNIEGRGEALVETRGAPPDNIPPSQKRRGNLAATLYPLLEPRRPVGRPGRPKGVSNYEWTPEIDQLLIEYSAKWGAARAKHVIGRKIREGRSPEVQSRPDSVRKAVEYRMEKLGLPTGQNRAKPETRHARRWTQHETAALLGALGADATIGSIAIRTGHTVKAVRAKLARLDYQAQDIHGLAHVTVDELAERIRVTTRQVRRWKEKGWLRTQGRKITEECLSEFLAAHADLVPFKALPRENQVYLIDLGYPCAERKVFRQNVREILDGIGRQRKPRRPIRREYDGETASEEAGLEDGEEATFQNTRQQPVSTLQMSASDPAVLSAMHCGNAERSFA